METLAREFIGVYLAAYDVIEIKSKEKLSPAIRQEILDAGRGYNTPESSLYNTAYLVCIFGTPPKFLTLFGTSYVRQTLYEIRHNR